MARTSEPTSRQASIPPGISRRSFIRRAGASAAGAAVLGGPFLNTAFGADRKKFHSAAKRPTCVATVGQDKVVTSDDDGHLIQWQVDGAVTNPIMSAANHASKKAAFVAFSNTTAHPRAFTAGYDGTVILHDLNNLADANAPRFGHHKDGDPKREVWVVAVSPDGKQAVSSTNDGQILLWDPANPAGPATPFGDFHDPVGGLAFIPRADGTPTEFLSTHAGGDVHQWNITKSKDPGYAWSHDNDLPVNAVAVDKSGKFFISASFDLTLQVWDLANRDSRKPLKTLRGHKNWVWRVAISPDSDLAASAGEDGYVHVWKLNGGDKNVQPWKSFGRFEEGVMGVTFTRQNRIVFTSGASKIEHPLTVQRI